MTTPFPAQPIIYVNFPPESAVGGDMHGLVGIADVVAQKLNGIVHHVSVKTLHNAYPADLPAGAYQKFVDDHGRPDILFTLGKSNFPKALHDKSIFVISEINEKLTEKYAANSPLVAHHITADLLNAEGLKFREKHPHIQHPILAVMVASDYNINGFTDSLMKICENDNKATIFICTSPRTSHDDFKRMKQAIMAKLYATRRAYDIVVESFHLNRECYFKGYYNPYLGLLREADHIVVCGQSQSMVSEALMTGKSVHVHHQLNDYSDLVNKGLVHEFNRASGKGNLVTQSVTPINLTEQIADGVIEDYRQHLEQSRRQAAPPPHNRREP